MMSLATAAALAASLAGPALAAGAAEPYGPGQLSLAREITDVVISPDGSRVAFASDITGAQELWTTRVSTAGPLWPEQLTGLAEQVLELDYSPDGKTILFAADRNGDERRDLYLVDAAGGPVEALTRTPVSETDPDADRGAAFSPGGERLAYVADVGSPAVYQLFVMDLATRKARQVTREGVSLRRPVWSPDGKTVVVSRTGDGQRGGLLFVELETGATRYVDAPTEGGLVLADDFLPDGSAVLCRAHNAKGFLQLVLVAARGGAGRFFGPSDWDVDGAAFRPGLGFVYSVNENGRSRLERLPAPGAKPVPLFGPSGHVVAFDLDDAGRRLALLWGDSTRPADVWVIDLKTGRKLQVTRALTGGVDPSRLKAAELVTYRAPDGVGVAAFHIPPASFRLGSPPPVIVTPHGGPDLQTFDEFDAKWQALSQAGFAVLAPNYRGSSGYGKAFLDLNNKDWGGKDLQDLWAGVESLAARGLADPKRAGITGGSYGGYLTLMALATMPERWTAGVEAYGMPDLKLDFELATERFLEWYKTEMGTPKTDPALFAERSAVTYLDRFKAPLLIFQGANDTNVPPAQSELIYRKLLERKVPVGLVVYPDEGHGFTRRGNRLDYYRRTVEFFVGQLGEPKAAPAPKGAPAGGGARE